MIYAVQKKERRTWEHVDWTLAAGVPLRTVARRGEHAQMSTTSNIYVYAIKSVDELATDSIGIY